MITLYYPHLPLFERRVVILVAGSHYHLVDMVTLPCGVPWWVQAVWKEPLKSWPDVKLPQQTKKTGKHQM